MDTIQDLIQTQPPLVPALSRLKKNLSSGILLIKYLIIQVDFVILFYILVLSLNNPKETNNVSSMSNSESSLFSIVSNSFRQRSLSKAELVERYKNIIIRSVEFIFASSKSNNVHKHV